MQEFIKLIENRCNKEEETKVKKAVMLAQEYYEFSWDKETGRRNLSQFEAAAEAARDCDLEEFWGPIISVFNQYSWNQIQKWAEGVN